MTIYEGITLAFIGVGIIFIILSLFFDKTRQAMNSDEASMEDDAFRKQVNLINDKIVELNDYHTYVQDEIEKKHKELLFLYQMIADKEKAVRTIQIEIEQLKIVLDQERRNSVSPLTDEDIETMAQSEVITSEAIIEKDITNKNKRIIELKKQGYDEMEIAKILEIGLGEVKLVLNLFE